MNIQKLQEEIKERQKRAPKIREVVNAYCQAEYGINDYFGTVDAFFQRHRKLTVVIARQIPNASVELIAFDQFVQWLNKEGIIAEATPFAFTRDVFSGMSHYKKSLTRVIFLYHKLLKNRQRKLTPRSRQVLCQKQRAGLDGRILNQLITQEGQTLPEYHYSLRRKVFGESDKIYCDASKFLSSLLCQCIKSGIGAMPDSMYIDKGNGREQRITLKGNFFDLKDNNFPRPPARWYYFFHLLMYLDGQRCLVRIVGDDDEECCAWFDNAIATIIKICGVEPLITELPSRVVVDEYESELLEIPMKFLNDNHWQDKIVLPSSSSTLYDGFADLAKQIISLA